MKSKIIIKDYEIGLV